MKPTLIIADAVPNIRKKLVDLLGSSFEIVGEASNGGQLVEQALATKPQLCLISAVLPHISGVEAAKLMRESQLRCGIVMLTGFLTDRLVLECLACGVDEILLKETGGEKLKDTLIRVIPKVEENEVRNLHP